MVKLTSNRPKLSRPPRMVANNSTTRMSAPMDCAHCSRLMNNFAGGYSRGPTGQVLCHPNATGRPDCYKLVTVYNHEVPCTGTVCYEDNHDFMEYVEGYKNG